MTPQFGNNHITFGDGNGDTASAVVGRCIDGIGHLDRVSLIVDHCVVVSDRCRSLSVCQIERQRGVVGRGSGGSNTLAFQGGGIFDLRAPTTLANIQTITAQEGAANNHPTINLRDGMHDVVNVASAAVGAKNPDITIYGANDSDTINLGSGNDDVFLGSTAETVIGGSGNSTFHVTAATIGAAIHGGTGSNLLDIAGGGTVTMGSNITGIKTVNLENACTS